MLKGLGICKNYHNRSSKQLFSVLKHCNIAIGSGEVVGLMGASGCGKSTLARILLRLVACEQGSIQFAGQDITNLSNSQLKFFRQQVQFISQRPESFFDPMFKLGKSLMEPLHIFDLPVDKDLIQQTLATVKLYPQLLERYPHQVSGGEIQRLSIARALLLQPKILILDEPTSMLDISVQAQVLQLLKTIQRTQNLSYLFISHDQQIINWMCDRQLSMRDGEIYPGVDDA